MARCLLWHEGRSGGFRRAPQEFRVLRCGEFGNTFARATPGGLVARRGDLALAPWATSLVCAPDLSRSARRFDAVRALPAPAFPRRASGGIRLYDAEMNREYFGTPEQPGPIYRTMQHAIDVGRSSAWSRRRSRPPT